MSSVVGFFKNNNSYPFFAVGIAWIGVAWAISAPLVLWPAVTLILGGLLLKVLPGERITWSWALSSAGLGLVLSVYQAYASLGVAFGPFARVALGSLLGFAIFALVHVFLLYEGNIQPEPK